MGKIRFVPLSKVQKTCFDIFVGTPYNTTTTGPQMESAKSKSVIVIQFSCVKKIQHKNQPDIFKNIIRTHIFSFWGVKPHWPLDGKCYNEICNDYLAQLCKKVYIIKISLISLKKSSELIFGSYKESAKSKSEIVTLINYVIQFTLKKYLDIVKIKLRTNIFSFRGIVLPHWLLEGNCHNEMCNGYLVQLSEIRGCYSAN